MADCNFRPFGVLKKSESESESEHSRLFFLNTRTQTHTENFLIFTVSLALID